VIVVGHHRGTRGRGYARMVVPRRHLASFCVQGIYSPALMQAITAPWQDRERGLQAWASQPAYARGATKNHGERPTAGSKRADDHGPAHN
jgi:hypothetical protein